MEIVGILTGIITFSLFWGEIYYVVKKRGTISHYLNLDKREKAIIILICIGISIWFYSLCCQDERIVNSDSGFYWIKNINYANNIFNNPIQSIKDTYRSINYSDYNDFLSAIISLPFLILGKGNYDTYRLLLFAMFQVPFYLIITDFICMILEDLNLKCVKYAHAITLLFCISVSYMYIPTVYGLYDIADLLIAVTIAFYLYKFDWGQVHIKDDLILCCLLLTVLFVIRHFSFFILMYFVCFMLVQLIELLIKKKDIKGYLKNTLVVGGVCSAVLVCFFSNYLKKTLLNNYSVAYSAYSQGTIGDKFVASIRWMGELVLILFLVGSLIFLIKKNFELLICETLSCIMTMYMLFRIQSLSCQHYYNFTVQVMVVMCVGLWGLVYILRFHALRGIGLIVEGAFMFALFVHGCVTSVEFGNALHLYSSVVYRPEVRDDMEAIGDLLKDTVTLTDELGGHAYLISSTGIFNRDVLRNYNLPNEMDAFPMLDSTCEIDLRDGFPKQFLEADVVMATDPVQTHVEYDGQRIIWKLNELMLDEHSCFADNFEVVNNYTITQGIDVYVFKKIKPFTEEDYEYLINVFGEWYPEYPELFVDRIKEVQEQNG